MQNKPKIEEEKTDQPLIQTGAVDKNDVLDTE